MNRQDSFDHANLLLTKPGLAVSLNLIKQRIFELPSLQQLTEWMQQPQVDDQQLNGT